MNKVYLSTSKLCEIYDVTKEYFLRKKAKNIFIKNTHYIENAKTLRWDIQEVENWWRDPKKSSKSIDDILNKIIPS